ncbi:MAG: hypothetical protein GX425_06300 [Peptococcaceae bacterium]|nr:hypothetical protein [Peptococcaceae bacterium]
MDQKQKVVIFIILIIVFLSIVLTEMKLWNYVNIVFVGAVTHILVPLELLAIFVCVRFYRALHNPFFKFQGMALAMSILVAGLRELRLILFNRFIYHFDESYYQALGASAAIISTIIGLAGILLALYALLHYREGWEQAEEVPLIKRFYDLIPSAGNNRLFCYMIIGVPLLLHVSLMLSSFSGSITDIIISVFNAVWLPAELLGLLLSLALLRIYKNNLFKYLVAVYIIPLVVIAFSYFNVFLSFFIYRFSDSNPPAYFTFSQIIFNYIVAFHKVVLAGLLVYALLTYRESMKEPVMQEPSVFHD